MSRTTLTLVCLAAVLLSAGCGGGGSGDRLSEAAFQARANRICKQLTRQEQPDLGTNSKAAVERDLGRIESAVSQLNDLQPPTRDETRFKEMLTNFQQSLDFVKEHEARLIELTDQVQAHPSDPRLTAQYQALVRPLVQEIRLAGVDANALGLSTCANGLTGGSSSNG